MVRSKQKIKPSAETRRGERKNLPTATKKKRRYRQGTVGVRKIRQNQLSTKNILAKKPFERIVRKYADKYSSFVGDTGVKITKDALNSMQDFIEDQMNELLSRVVNTSVYNKRMTVYWKDVLFVATDFGMNSPELLSKKVSLQHMRSKK